MTTPSRDVYPVAAVSMAEPIFILGIRPRCGTHFLANLLCQHPACVKGPLAEDALLVDADLLAAYADRHVEQWAGVSDGPWRDRGDLLLECLGDALARFLERAKARGDAERRERFATPAPAPSSPNRIVTKTPLVEHLDLFFRLWPRGQAIILIRDGRAVVESNVRSFGGSRDAHTRAWAAAADRVAAFRASFAALPVRFRIVRYEDLHANTDETMHDLLSFLELDVRRYDFDRARDLPIVGSSTFKRGAGRVNWMPVRRTPDFDPLARADAWPRAWHERFNWLAGRQMRELGYPLRTFAGSSWPWAAMNRAKDLTWAARRLARVRGGTAEKRRGTDHST